MSRVGEADDFKFGGGVGIAPPLGGEDLDPVLLIGVQRGHRRSSQESPPGRPHKNDGIRFGTPVPDILVFGCLFGFSGRCFSRYRCPPTRRRSRPDGRAALDHISAQSLEGHVSFLASDRLEGRDTPSPGLDIAAEYIAAQFRRAGLKPAGDDGYFQTAPFIVSELSSAGAKLTVESGDAELRLEHNNLRVIWAERLEFSDVVPVKVDTGDVTPEAIEGKVVVIALRRINGLGAALRALAKAKPAAALMIQNRAVDGPEVHKPPR